MTPSYYRDCAIRAQIRGRKYKDIADARIADGELQMAYYYQTRAAIAYDCARTNLECETLAEDIQQSLKEEKRAAARKAAQS